MVNGVMISEPTIDSIEHQGLLESAPADGNGDLVSPQNSIYLKGIRVRRPHRRARRQIFSQTRTQSMCLSGPDVRTTGILCSIGKSHVNDT